MLGTVVHRKAVISGFAKFRFFEDFGEGTELFFWELRFSANFRLFER
jgi:hypothetical protein